MKRDRDLITSYGILLFYKASDGELRYLLSQRRDTIEYTDYIKGKYLYTHLQKYFSLMTQEERDRLVTYNFDDLWGDLWVDHENRLYREMKDRSKIKFSANIPTMKRILGNTKSKTIEPGWGFPKGKRNGNEDLVACALREFCEETNLILDYSHLVSMTPAIEIFKGSNDKMYKTVYYIAQVPEEIMPPRIPVDGIRTDTISEEVYRLRWLTVDKATSLLPEHRAQMLMDANARIKENF